MGALTPCLSCSGRITSERQYQKQCIIHCLAKEFLQTRVEAIHHWSPLVIPELENNDMEATWLESLFLYLQFLSVCPSLLGLVSFDLEIMPFWAPLPSFRTPPLGPLLLARSLLPMSLFPKLLPWINLWSWAERVVEFFQTRSSWNHSSWEPIGGSKS